MLPKLNLIKLNCNEYLSYLDHRLVRNVLHAVIIILITSSALSALLVMFGNEVIVRDWGYFYGKSLFNHDAIWKYGVYPLHDPYMFGGQDLLANPQANVLSPFILFDLLFRIPYSVVFHVAAYMLIGSFGAYNWFKYNGASRLVSYVCVFIFVHGSFFSLHLAEGHVTFAGFYLFPLALMAIQCFRDDRYKLIFFGIQALWLLDGAMYTFIFQWIFIGLGALTCYFVYGWRWLFFQTKTRFNWNVLLLLVATVMLLLPRVLSIVSQYGTRVPESDTIESNSSILTQAFFSQKQEGFRVFEHQKLYPFHEVGSYIGWYSLLFIVLYLIIHKVNKKDLILLVMGSLFLWMASGFCGSFNPIKIVKQLPLVKNIHIPQRFIFLVWILLLFYLSHSLTWLQTRLHLLVFSVILLIVSMNFREVYAFAFKRVTGYAHSTVSKAALNFSIQSKSIDQTLQYPYTEYYPETKNSGFEFLGYKWVNTAFKDTYDPAKPIFEVKSILDSTYRNEVFFEPKNLGYVKLLEYIPGKIQLYIHTNRKGKVKLNTGFLQGWSTSSKHIKVINDHGLLALDVNDFKGKLTIYYGSPKRNSLFIFYIIGLGLFVYLIYSTRKDVRLR